MKTELLPFVLKWENGWFHNSCYFPYSWGKQTFSRSKTDGVQLSLHVSGKVTCFTRGEQIIVNCSFSPLMKKWLFHSLNYNSVGSIRIITTFTKNSVLRQYWLSHYRLAVTGAVMAIMNIQYCASTGQPVMTSQ